MDKVNDDETNKGGSKMNDINEEPPITNNVISISDHLEKVLGEKPCFWPDDWKPVGWDTPPDHYFTRSLRDTLGMQGDETFEQAFERNRKNEIAPSPPKDRV